MNDLHRASYLDEAAELLVELEQALLQLEERSSDQEIVGWVFRLLHTIKGSGAMFGFDKVAALTHEVETVYDLVRSGRIAADRELIDLTLAVRDCIRLLLHSDAGTDPEVEMRASSLAGTFRELARPFSATPSPVAAKASPAPELQEAEATYRIRFKPSTEILRQGGDPALILQELRELGECRIVAQTCDIPLLEELEPDRCHLFWDVILTTSAGLNAVKDVFLFEEGNSEIAITTIGEGSAGDCDSWSRLGEILIERGDLSAQDLERVLAERSRIDKLLVDEGLVMPDRVASALEEIEHLREKAREHGTRERVASIRVPAEKLDRLVDLVGELVTVQARLTQTVGQQQSRELFNIAEEVERLTAELRVTSLDIRMLPIGTTFSKFRRIIRDLSQEVGKEIQLVTEGAETELDKTVIEKLNDPLVHIIRNSVDHGIESVAERVAAGKPPHGVITLAASHSGDSVVIRISDDGKGLDRDAIYAKGVATGLISGNQEISERQLYNLIFAPGFSTAGEITGLSGRGVGMDVVKKTIDAMRGSIDLRSQKGKGTTITIRLPLTLAIIESLLVEIGGSRFVIPLHVVDECMEITDSELAAGRGKHIVKVREQQVPFVNLRQRFEITAAAPEVHQVVIGRINGMQVGFLVDHVIGEHQTVIKSLGKLYRGVTSLSGATILGDGTVALILNLDELLEHEFSLCEQSCQSVAAA